MFLFTNFLLFIVIWWMIFFISLPINISVPKIQQEGHASSAPKKTYIALKATLTTIISTIIMFILIFFKFNLGMFF